MSRLVGIAVLVLCLLVPAAAPAAEDDDDSFAAFAVEGSHGYRIAVFASAEEGDGSGRVLLLAMHRSGERAAMYQAKATVTPTSLSANFGALGRINLVLAKSGKEKGVRFVCGGRTRIEKATYWGAFEFNGEQGFTRARASRIASNPALLIDLLYCGGGVNVDVSDPDFVQPRRGALLRVLAKQGKRSVLFVEAVKNHPSGRAVIRVNLRENRPGISITRSVGMFAGASAFDYDSALRSAILDPPEPFSGSARFRREAKPAARWSGDLRVDLPGRANVSLARPELRPKLGRGNWSVQDPAFGRALLGGPLALLEAH